MDATPSALFVIVLLLQLVKLFLSNKFKLDRRETELRSEIRRLKREADALSGPSTFAQSAKLKRLSASKEKELAQVRVKVADQKSSSNRMFYVVMACVYLVIALWCWKTPVASLPNPLVQPFGSLLARLFGWPVKSQISSDNMFLKVGVLPWLILSNRVGAYLSGLLLTAY